MKTYLLNVWDNARTSYWFVPSLFAACALALSVFVPLLDGLIKESDIRLPRWACTTTDTARATLTALAGAMVAVTGTVFSITIVTLSLTSQQFGPRLLRRFMYDLPTQVTLGVFLSTGFYCLLVLRLVQHRGDVSDVPHLSVLTAVLMAVASMAMLIVFIHHVAMLIQAPHVVAAVASDLDDAIIRLFPNTIEEPVARDEDEERCAEIQNKLSDDPLVLHSKHSGYIQALDIGGVVRVVRDADCVAALQSRPGDFVTSGTPIAHIWNSTNETESLDAERLAEAINETIIVGARRTPRQDIECAIEELVEVAVRSLSPGINDPFTATNCIDHLGASLSRLAEREFPNAYRCDDEGTLRVILQPVSFSDVLDAAFNQIRQYGHDSVAVTIRLMEALNSISERARRMEDREAALHHATMTARAAEAFSKEDREDVLARLLHEPEAGKP